MLVICPATILFSQVSKTDSLIRAAQQTSSPAEISDLLLEASKAFRRSNLDSSEKYLKLATQYANQSEDGDRITKCQMSLGALHWMKGNLDEAGRQYEKALKYWQKQQDEVEMARCMLNLGNVNQSQRENDDALTYLRQASHLAAKAGEKLIEAQAAGTAATVFFQLEQADSVMAYSEMAYDAFQQLGDSANMARSQCNLGYYFSNMDRSQEARQYYHNAMDLIQHSTEKSLIGEVNEGLGNLEYRTGNYDQAVTHTLVARKMFKELGWTKRIAGNDILLGLALQTMGRTKAAREHFWEAHRLADSMGLNQNAAIALSNLADVYAEEGDCNLAITTYRKALATDAKGPHDPNIFSKHLGMSRCFRTLGMSDSAEVHLQIAFQSARQLGKAHELGNGFLELAESALENHQFQVAITHLDSAQKWFSVDLQPKGLFESWGLRSRTLEAMGDYVGALQAQRTASQWQDSIFTTIATEQLLSLEAKYWGDKKEHSLELARQNAVMQEIEAERAREESDKLAAQRNLLISAILLILVFGGMLFYLNLKRRENKHQSRIAELRMTALRAQMNPHFIFNALGSVQLLINTQDVRRANLYLSKFARLLRMILENSSKKEIPLEDEMESLALYVELEALRFKFQYRFEVDEHIQTSEVYLPSMLIQPMVENAVKHGLSAKKENGLLEIELKRVENELVCTVRDNGVGRQQAASTGKEPENRVSMGTQITEERLAQLLPKKKNRLVITDLTDEKGNATGTQVELFLPYRTAH